MAGFIRYISVQVGRLFTDSHYIVFSIRRRSTDTQADGDVRIYNLSDNNEELVTERGLPVVLAAGYLRPQQNVSEIFRGDVVRFERQRIGNDRVSVVHVGNEVMRQTSATIERTYDGRATVHQIINDLVRELRLSAGSLEDIPNTTLFNYRVSGPVTDSLRRLLEEERIGLRFYIDGGVVYFTQQGRPSRGPTSRFVISQDSGMIGTPTVTDDGIRVRTILENRIHLGAIFRVVSLGRSLGDYKVVEIEHSGDNRQGEFVSLIEGRPL